MRKRLVIMMCSGLQLQAQVTMIQQILRNCESVHLFEISRNGSARVGGFAEALVVHDEQAALSEEHV